MNLESIEQHSLNYLTQVSNPLVRIDVLHAHLRDRDLAVDMDTARLKTFLEHHALFRVMPPISVAPDAQTPAPDAGAAYVILAARVPTQAQISAMMLEQLIALEQALFTARAEALEIDDALRAKAIEDTLRRLAALRDKLGPSPNPGQAN